MMASSPSSSPPPSISAPTTPHKRSFTNSHNFLRVKRPSYPHPPPFPALCRCSAPSSADNNNNSSFNRRWDLVIQDAFKNAVKLFDSFLKEYGAPQDDAVLEEEKRDESGEDEWDWDRWKSHFDEVDDQERLVSILKSQLGNAVFKEEYDDAARLKVAIAAAATNDAVGRVMSNLNRAVVQERYEDAALLRDNAGAGLRNGESVDHLLCIVVLLVGWWAGISEDKKDPYGLIIRVTAEHGKYVARSYSPRQLATAAAGVPLFEIFLTVNKKGEYQQQAVYLKRKGVFDDSSVVSSKASGGTGRLNPPGSTEDKDDLLVVSAEDTEDGDESDDSSDLAEGLSGFQNILRDMIPGVRVKVLKVTAPGKVDRDFISKVIEQIMEEEDEEKDAEVENVESEDEDKDESDEERNEIEMDAGRGIIENEEEQTEVSVKVVVGGLVQKLPGNKPAKEFLRVPAKLEKKGRLSFSFSIEKDSKRRDSGAKDLGSVDNKARLGSQRSIENVMLDLAKFIGREKIPLKVLKDLSELINLSLSQAQNHQPLSGSTTFHRIETATSQDALNGLYIGAHGLHTSEVINLRRKFGQWQDDGGIKNPSNLEFYEYVEAIKVTGDPYVPAGQVAFRAKVGKRYQLPHKGIIPEEFGVIARYKGQGRLAEPGFQNPRWVDGELVILDGKKFFLKCSAMCTILFIIGVGSPIFSGKFCPEDYLMENIISDGFLSNCKEYVLLKVCCFHIADSDDICYPEVPFQVELLIVPGSIRPYGKCSLC
ncbi:protein EXECUTER 1 [Citrus sinensis]|uniref:Protein EXECUTER 1 n=1 Tax=Citrus sinensis TaxID=2711 RepID=A0ACB8IJR7_CITSI|nr:protein EXECUTER 1 [Citrus sinensis]